MFENTTLDRTKNYLLPCLSAIDTTLRSFQYKVLIKALFLNKKECTFGITNTVLCSFCKSLQETLIHIFYDCIHVKYLWEKLQTKFQSDIILPSLTAHAAILRPANKANSIYNVLNRILLVFRYHIYRSREKHILSIDILIDNLIEIQWNLSKADIYRTEVFRPL